MLPVLAAILLSSALLTALCVADPKRRRSARLAETAQGAGLRRGFAAAAAVPGLLLAGSGDAAAFFVWLGACAVAGWLLAQLFNRRLARSD